jgi:catechol-2,3-dioxygenase
MNSPKVLGLSGVGLEVPDLEVARRFYVTFGLQAEQTADRLVLRSPGRSNGEIIVVRGATKRMHHLSFFIDPEAEAAFGEKLAKAGIDVRASSAMASLRPGLWFRDPWGTLINLNPKRPVPAISLPEYNIGGRSSRIDVPLWQELPRNRLPIRLGHVLIFTPDWERAEKFFVEVMGMRTTDRTVAKVAFMAAGEGVTDHHCFGLINGTHRGLQHASFQVASMDDIGFGAWRMVDAGYKEGFGPGRHAIASNLFHYTRDPWGSWIEYYADMDKITADWKCRDWNELPYIWGPEWSPEFWGQEMNANLEPR